MLDKLRFFNTGKVPDIPARFFECEYPYTWFQNNAGSKPSIFIPQTTNLNMDNLRQRIWNGTQCRPIHFDDVIEYLYNVLVTKTERLEADWKSYGVLIGEANTYISPFSILNVQRKPTRAIEGNVGGTSVEKDDAWMCLWLLSMYRLERASVDGNIRDCIKLVFTTIRTLGGPKNLNLQTAIAMNTSWAKSSEFLKVVAAIDMFYYMFEKSTLSVLRIGTSGSRYRYCAALKNYHYISGLLGFKVSRELLSWVFNRTIAIEAKYMFVLEDEYEKNESYFPYHIDLGLVNRSPFSARLNPALHFFTNVIGAMMGSTRCLNAPHLLKDDITQVLYNAQLVGYVFMSKTTRSLGKNLKDTSEHRALPTQLRQSTNQQQSKIADQQPRGCDPNEWFNYMELRDRKPDEDMKAEFLRIQSQVGVYRDGTIGQFIKSAMFC